MTLSQIASNPVAAFALILACACVLILLHEAFRE